MLTFAPLTYAPVSDESPLFGEREDNGAIKAPSFRQHPIEIAMSKGQFHNQANSLMSSSFSKTLNLYVGEGSNEIDTQRILSL